MLKYIVSLIVDKAFKAFLGALQVWFKKVSEAMALREAAKKDEETRKKYEETLNSETKTEEELKDATSDFLNSDKR